MWKLRKKIFRQEMEEARSATGGKVIEETSFDLIAFAFAMLLGYTIGKFKIDLRFIGLGFFFIGVDRWCVSRVTACRLHW